MAAYTDIGLQGPDGFRLDPSAWGPVGVRGADKVAQRYAYFLLTPLGSVPGRPDDGSVFVDAARGFRSEFDVWAAFAASDAAAARSVRAAESDDEPDSEKYGSSRLANVTIADGILTLSVLVTAKDGSVPSAPVVFATAL